MINDPEDISEIASKLENLLEKENHTRLLVELDRENTSWKSRALELKAALKGIER